MRALEDKDHRLTAALRELGVLKQQHGELLHRTASTTTASATAVSTAASTSTATGSAPATATTTTTGTAPASHPDAVTLESRVRELESGANGARDRDRSERAELERAAEAARAELAALKTVHFSLQDKADKCAKRLLAVHR